MAKGYECPWTTWKCLNHWRTGYTFSKTQRKKWKFYTGDTICSCGRAEETTAHMLQCSQLAPPCSLDYLITFNDVGKQCVELWTNIVNITTMMTTSYCECSSSPALDHCTPHPRYHAEWMHANFFLV